MKLPEVVPKMIAKIKTEANVNKKQQAAPPKKYFKSDSKSIFI